MMNACLICSYCQHCIEDEDGHPTCEKEPGLDCSTHGDMEGWGFDSDGECDCTWFDGVEVRDDEPSDEDYFYDGRYDYCPSVFDRL